MQKLCQVINLVALGGTTTLARTIVRALPDWQHEIQVLGPMLPGLAEQWQLPARRVHWVKPTDADIVLMHNTDGYCCRTRPEQPTIQWHHSGGDRARADIDMWASHWLRNRRPGMRMIQGVDCATVEPTSDDATWRDQQPFVVGRLATAHPAKWPAELADGMVRAHLPDMKWHLIGGACLSGRLAKGPLAGTRIDAPNPDAAGALCRWHVLWYPNPKITDSFGRVIIEAMAAGCVPLVDARGGPAEIAEMCGTTDAIRACRSEAEMIEALHALHANRDRWIQASYAARALAHIHFGLPPFRERLVQAFGTAELLRRRRRA